MRISVVSVTYNSLDVIGDMLGALGPDLEVVVVDNSSTDGTPAMVAAARDGVTLVDLPTNGGFGRGCNVGAGVATGDVLVFLNPDCRPQPGALELLAEMAAADPSSIFGPALLHDDGSARHNLRRASRPRHEILELLPSAGRWVPRRWRRDLPADDPRYAEGGEVDYLQGACLAVSRERFMSIGGFDEDFFLYSEEETLCQAIIAAGGRCIYVPNAVVAHAGASSTDVVSRFALRHAYRSRAIFYRKRYGELRGQSTGVAIALAALLSWMLSPLAAAVGGRAAQLPRTQWDSLRGLFQGMSYRIGRL